MAKKRKQKYLTRNNQEYYTDSPVNTYSFGSGFKDAFKVDGTKLGSSVANVGLGAISSIGGGLANSAISGGLESGAGNVIGGLGKMASAIPGPWGAVASVGLQAVGGLVNRAFGSKLNQENINAANQNISAMSNFKSDAGSFDELSSNISNQPATLGFDQNFIGKDGWFSNKAKRKFNELKAKQDTARAFVQSSIANNAENLDTTQDQNLLANFAAYGGGIHIKPENKGKFTASAKRAGMGVQEFASHVLANKDDYSSTQVKRANFARNAAKWHAFGGDLLTNGSMFDQGYTYIGNGDTHEKNPNEGVQMGVDGQGVPNLVEEGEIILDDYVLSNRYGPSKEFADKYKMNKTQRKKSFAQLFKDSPIVKEANERPNDKSSQNALAAFKQDLMQEQEKERFKRMSPEEKAQLLQEQAAQEGGQYAHGGRLANKFVWGSQMDASADPDFEGNLPYLNVGINPDHSYYKDYVGYVFKDREDKGKGKQIDFDAMYKEGSDFMKARQLYIDNWDNPKFKKYRDAYIQRLQAEAKDEGYDNDYSKFDVEDFKRLTQDRKAGYAHDLSKSVLTAMGFYANGDPVVFGGETPINNNQQTYWGFTDDMLTGNLNPQASTSYWDAARKAGYTGLPEGPLWEGAQAVMGADYKNPSAPIYVDKDGNKVKADTKTAAKAQTNPEQKTDEKQDLPLFDNWMRYAPIVGSAIGLTQGLLSKPDYGNAELLEKYADNAGQYDPIKATPIGDYMTYRPLDRQYAINLLNAQSGATRRNIMNTSGGNRGQAMAGLLAADYNAGNQIGNLFRQAEEYNLGQRERVSTFNRDTNKFNAQQQMQADLANQQARMQASSRNAELRARAAAMRQAIDDQRAAGITANFSNLFESIGDIGQERVNRQTAGWMANKGLYGNFGKKNANGGKIKRKKKGLTC